MSKASLETAIRNDILTAITELLTKKFDTDVMPVSASELTIPVLDAEGNEKFALVKVSIPRGTRNGEGGYTDYDGYAAAKEYAEDLAEKAAKKAASAEKKANSEKAKERRAAARKVVKKLNTEGLDKMIHEEEKDDEN